MLTGAEDNIVLSRPPSIPCTTSHKTCQQLPYNKRHPNIRVPLNARSVGLAGQPGIPPMAAPPEASYRRPEDIIVLSHMPRITRDAYTKYICVHHFFLIGRGTPYRVPLDARSMGSARQTGHTPHGRTSATPSPQRMKILTKILARQSCSRVQRTILFYLTRTAYHALLHTKHAAKPYNKRHPIQGAFWARSMGLAGQPGIPPMAAPPEASYRRPEENIVLSALQ